MKNRKDIKKKLLRFGLENVGIAVFGALIALLPRASGFFEGKEAMFGVVAGVYWVPPLCNALLRKRSKVEALGVGSVGHEAQRRVGAPLS